jgi:hypothetical protein
MVVSELPDAVAHARDQELTWRQIGRPPGISSSTAAVTAEAGDC